MHKPCWKTGGLLKGLQIFSEGHHCYPSPKKVHIKNKKKVMMCRDAHTVRFSYREPNQYTKSQSRNWKISWQNQWLFPPKSLCQLHNAHTYTQISQIHTPVIVSFALFHLTTKKKKKSLKNLVALTFNLAFTRAYSGLWDVVWAARQKHWPQSVARLCIKCFWITTLSISYW